MSATVYEYESNIPNPGSMEAAKRGCTCRQTTNNHGESPPYPWATGSDSLWDVNPLCRLHGRRGNDLDGGR